MEQIAFDQLQEKLYYEKMANGLDVYVLPKNGFNKTLQHLRQNTDRSIITLSRLIKMNQLKYQTASPIS